MTIFKNLISSLRSKFVLFKFNVKKSLFSISVKQLSLRKKEYSVDKLWDGSFFPNYGTQDTQNRSTNSFKALTSLASPSVVKSVFNQSYNLPKSSPLYLLYIKLTLVASWCLNAFKRSFGEGAIYIRGLVILFVFDAMLTDDEPLWEPVEWSLVQTWIMFIFAFAWIGENLISSRFGSFTGRDKRVWFSWYKTFWLIEGWYVLSLAGAALFVIVPFYHEISYTLPLVVSWWNWYSRVFFFKFISAYSLILYIAYYLQLNLGFFHWRKSLFLILLVNMFLSYLLYTHFMMSFFGYFTDPNWYHKTRLIDYVHLSHEPNKWSWGNAKRDHFSYHKSTTVFWFKNDGPFASAFLLFHIMFFLCLFALYLYWVTLFRRVYCTKEITYTYTTFCVSALRQFFYYFLLTYLLVFFSFIVQYWRLPIEYLWVLNNKPILSVLYTNLFDYPSFIFSLF